MVTELLAVFFLLLSYYYYYYIFSSSSSNKSKSQYPASHFPKSYPLIGSALDIAANKERRVQWTSDILRRTSTATFTLDLAFGSRRVFTADPANVQHMLKSHFINYQKGFDFRSTLFDLLGDGIFNADGDTWKLQRQLSSHAFNTRSLRKFVETVVDSELTTRLIPTLSSAAASGSVLDLQDVLQRFAFDNICVIAFGYDPVYLAPSLPEARFAVAFEDAVRISSERFNSAVPQIWKMKKFLGIGSEYRLKQLVSEVRDFAKKVIQEKKQSTKTEDSVDLLSRFLNPASDSSYDDDFIVDIVISFILAGRDTTSAALTWFFWLLWKNPEAESKILEEIGDEKSKSELPIYEEVKDMVYTHASLCEAMRLYPPVPIDTKVAAEDDVLPDGTAVKKGVRVSYHPYAMGRMEEIWGKDWAEFKPERWLEKKREEDGEKWNFVGRDPYSYPVFQAGPRVCLGKEMAFLQMKRVVAGILRRYKVVPSAMKEPVLISYLTAKMKGGFPVRFQEREVPGICNNSLIV